MDKITHEVRTQLSLACRIVNKLFTILHANLCYFVNITVLNE